MIPRLDPDGRFVVWCENAEGHRLVCHRRGEELRFRTETDARRYARWCRTTLKSVSLRYWVAERADLAPVPDDLALEDHLSVCMMCAPDTDTLCVAGAAMRAAAEAMR